MNILFIGPYRLNNNIGYESLNILLNLQETFPNIVSKPIYNQSPINKLEELNLLLYKLENRSLKNFDLLIQHTDIESMVYTTKINKHIFLPVLQNKLNTYTQTQIVQTLQSYGLFLAYKEVDNFILDHSQIHNKQEYKLSIHNRATIAPNGSFNFGLYDMYKKYYTITDAQNEKNIKDLIIDFISQINDNSSCLVLFMHNITQPILDKYNHYIKHVYGNMGINHSISKIIIVPVELENKSISTMHRCGDLYVDINNDIHAYYALRYGKPVIHNSSDLCISYNQNDLTETPKVSHNKSINLSELWTEQNNTRPLLTEIISKYV